MDEGAFSGFRDEERAAGADGSGAERRSSGRYRTICRVARVRRGADAGLWLVRNISNEGLMLAADVAATVGEPIEIALSETVNLAGAIVWADGGRFGVAFDAPIDAAATLRALAAEQRAEGYRALRLPIEIEAVVALRGDARAIDLVDISQSGAGFVFGEALEVGAELDLLLPGGDLRRHALVRWARGTRGGLWFTRPLDRADLETLAGFRR
ncbi:PilZ domain-containing protein [Sphingopyxis sp. YR583]|uniref:PilZ domain-containing protein n=1 Tax=Sphingopyxis sp. YR583 TaxID=1881047 RepID=UPI0008A78EFC|nr:PilZ domain-containing protein [Sphingopyxis sp. YR583]SEH12734.1 PilZ domain-containing protein [Sphingopyxis sp. YR583]